MTVKTVSIVVLYLALQVAALYVVVTMLSSGPFGLP